MTGQSPSRFEARGTLAWTRNTLQKNVNARPSSSRRRWSIREGSDRLHLGQIIADRLGAAANTRIGALEGFRDLREIQGQRLHRHVAAARQRIIADSGIFQFVRQKGFDLALGGCRELDLDLAVELARYGIEEQFRRGDIGALRDGNLAERRFAVLARCRAARRGADVTRGTPMERFQLDPVLEAVGRDRPLDAAELHIDGHGNPPASDSGIIGNDLYWRL